MCSIKLVVINLQRSLHALSDVTHSPCDNKYEEKCAKKAGIVNSICTQNSCLPEVIAG